MEDPTEIMMQSPTKSPYKNDPFESTVSSTWIRSAADGSRFFSEKLSSWGVEERGIRPVDVEDRTDTHFFKIFFVWLSANMNILPFASGTLGPGMFGLGLRDSCLVILLFNLICAVPPAYLTTWGPKLGLRQMCASRYTFGYYGAMIPCLIAVAAGVCFSIMNSILGGQALASIANISWTVGIVIISVISLFVSFCGLRVLNWYQNFAWAPFLLVFVVAAGVSGKDFVDTATPPATMVQIFNFGATVAGYMIPWSGLSSDYTAYFHPRVSSWRIFAYSYLGLTLPTITLECLGAAAAISAFSIPDWEAGYADGNIGGLLNAMLSPVGKFGKVLMVLLSLSVTTTTAPTIYSMCMAFQTFIPPAAAVPRYVLSVFAAGVITVLSIVGQHKFYVTFSNFLGIIGYWAGAFVSMICVEHLYFRKGNFANYDLRSWNVPSELPLGAAALIAPILSFAVVIPSVNQAWYTGPIARKIGDVGFEAAVLVTALCYIPARFFEKRWRGF